MKSCRVLIVAKDPLILSSLRLLLELEGYQVWTAANGRDGLLLLGSQAVDVVVADCFQEEMSGLDFLREARSNGGPKIPFVGLSARRAGAGETEQFDAWLEKPVGLQTLLQTLEAVTADSINSPESPS